MLAMGINEKINLFNPSDHQLGSGRFISATTGNIFGYSSAQRKYLISYLSVLPNTEYLLSVDPNFLGEGASGGERSGMAFYNDNKEFISGIVFNKISQHLQFTTPAECSFLRFCINATSSNVSNQEAFSTVILYQV